MAAQKPEECDLLLFETIKTGDLDAASDEALVFAGVVDGYSDAMASTTALMLAQTTSTVLP